MNTQAQEHPFFYTLGPGPYFFTKMKKGGSCCAHCGTPITLLCYVKTGENREFTVGSTCISNMSANDSFLNLSEFARTLKMQKLKSARESRERSRLKKIAELKAFIVENSEILKNYAHPHSYFDEQGKTAKDYADYMSNFCRSASSAREAINKIKSILKGE